jgi:hypothetical protein
MRAPIRRPWLAALACAAVAAALGVPATASVASFYVNVASSKPKSVGKNRFAYISDRAGRHWRQTYRGRTGRRAGYQDGRNVIGFSYHVGGDVAGQTVGWDCYGYFDSRGRNRERCREWDIMVNPSLRWEDGPGYPSRSRLDLLTIMLHEFGHFAGFPDHVPRCTNSPMSEAIYSGEWWRSSRDYRWLHCDGGPRSSGAGSSSTAFGPPGQAFRL